MDVGKNYQQYLKITSKVENTISITLFSIFYKNFTISYSFVFLRQKILKSGKWNGKYGNFTDT